MLPTRPGPSGASGDMEAVLSLLEIRLGQGGDGHDATQLFQDFWAQLKQGTEMEAILQVRNILWGSEHARGRLRMGMRGERAC